MSKTPLSFVDTLPVHLRRACSAMSADGGFRAWLDERYGAGKWALGDIARGDVEVAIPNREYADLAVEYGHKKLSEMFGGEVRDALRQVVDRHGGLGCSPAIVNAFRVLDGATHPSQDRKATP